MNKIVQRMRQGFNIPLDATDGERKQRLLDTLLLATTAIALIMILMNVIADVLGLGGDRQDLTRMYVAGVTVLLGNSTSSIEPYSIDQNTLPQARFKASGD